MSKSTIPTIKPTTTPSTLPIPTPRPKFNAHSPPKPNYTRLLSYCDYDGSSFHGFMIQPNVATVQGTIEKLLKSYFKGEDIVIAAAGRTDRDVSARGMAFHFDIQDKDDEKYKAHNILRAFQSLPNSVHVTSCVNVSGEFHARHSCVAKRYKYKVLFRRPTPFEDKWSWSVSERSSVCKVVDVEKIEEAASFLVEVHDFSAFCVIEENDPRSPVREMKSVTITTIPNGIEISYTADRFLYKQCRIMTGTLLEVGLNRMSVDAFKALLDRPENKKGLGKGVVAAPGRGLMLDAVFYGEAEEKRSACDDARGGI